MNVFPRQFYSSLKTLYRTFCHSYTYFKPSISSFNMAGTMLVVRVYLHIIIYGKRWMFKIVEIKHNKVNVLLGMLSYSMVLLLNMKQSIRGVEYKFPLLCESRAGGRNQVASKICQLRGGSTEMLIKHFGVSLTWCSGKLRCKHQPNFSVHLHSNLCVHALLNRNYAHSHSELSHAWAPCSNLPGISTALSAVSAAALGWVPDVSSSS